MNTVPTTELEAVNQILAAIGESPISSLGNSGNADAAVARQTLHNVSREVQSKGWHWNTEYKLELVPSVPDGFLYIPENTIKVDPVDSYVDAVRRGSRLYDPVRSSYVFDKSITVEAVTFLPFADLPEPARNFITLRAARRFQENQLGSTELSNFQRRDEMQAWADLLHEEVDSGDYNLKRSSDTVMQTLVR